MQPIFRQTLSLALLEGKRIPAGLLLLRQNVSALKRRQLSESAIKKFEKIFDYIDSYWLKDWSATDISFYGEKQRTNNHLESYHRGLNDLFRKNPAPTKFLRKTIVDIL